MAQMVACMYGVHEVASSNLVTQTIEKPVVSMYYRFFTFLIIIVFSVMMAIWRHQVILRFRWSLLKRTIFSIWTFFRKWNWSSECQIAISEIACAKEKRHLFKCLRKLFNNFKMVFNIKYIFFSFMEFVLDKLDIFRDIINFI